jgi:hypothetical protein
VAFFFSGVGTQRKTLDPGLRRDDDFEFRSFYKLISDARAAVFGQLWYGEWMPVSLPNVIPAKAGIQCLYNY